MPNVKAGPNEYLLVGRGGTLENRGPAVQTFLWPGTIWVLVPSTKQEASFEFTQETRDGIPLRFKGIIRYRVTEPVQAARQFDFSAAAGIDQISTFLTHVCLGELRHAVSHMTMVECIEQRKTTLSGVADAALQATIVDGDGQGGGWGVTIEVAQVAQVFIVDTTLRQQLEAEVRNEIKLKSDQSAIKAQEETRLAEMASAGRVEDLRVAGDREALRRAEELELAQVALDRRRQRERVATERQALELEQERFRAEMAAEQDRVATEAPVRQNRLAIESDLLRAERTMRELQNQVRALEVEHELLLARATQDLRREILPLEQAPRIVEAASGILHGTNLSLYGDDAALLGQVAPVFEVLARTVRDALVPGIAEDPER
jgi:hypothetical protein